MHTTLWQVQAPTVSTEEGLQYKCRKCGSDAGVMCVYIAGQYASYVNRSRAGTPCTKIHRERRNDARAARVKQWKQARREADRLLIETRRASRDSMSAWHAMLEWERQEHEALRWWLETHGHILWKEHHEP